MRFRWLNIKLASVALLVGFLKAIGLLAYSSFSYKTTILAKFQKFLTGLSQLLSQIKQSLNIVENKQLISELRD